jgi:hypothetical protein
VEKTTLLPLLRDAAGRRGREAPLTEAMDLLRSVLLPLDEVAQQCWQAQILKSNLYSGLA